MSQIPFERQRIGAWIRVSTCLRQRRDSSPAAGALQAVRSPRRRARRFSAAPQNLAVAQFEIVLTVRGWLPILNVLPAAEWRNLAGARHLHFDN